MTISLLDVAIIVFYLVGILTIGVLSTRKGKVTGNVFFLAGRSLKWWIVGIALFASNISTIHLVGFAASGYNEGLVWGNFEFMSGFTLILLALVFSPFYFNSKISTLPEYLEKRYSPASRSILALIAILTALLMHIGMSLYAGAAVFERFFGIPLVTSIGIVAFITLIYTAVGGLRAVVVTETIQASILISGAITITVLAILALPAHGIHSWSQLSTAVKPGQLSMIHKHDSAGLAWYAVLLGYPVLGVWYWCTDQTIVQRVLGAETQRDAQIGPILTGFLKILPVLIMVLPGVLGYVMFRNVIGSASNDTLPVLIEKLVPPGLRGLISAAILASLMSAVAAALNSSGTLVAVDIVKRFRPKTTDRAQVWIGRISSIIVMVLACLWSTQGGKYSSIFGAVNSIAAELAPPVTTVFIWGVFWRRGTKEACLLTLILGFVLGACTFVLDLPAFGTEKIITNRWGIPFMMQAWWLFCICSIIYVAVSLLTPRPAREQVEGLTWDHPFSVISKAKFSGVTDVRILAGLLVISLATLYYLFR